MLLIELENRDFVMTASHSLELSQLMLAKKEADNDYATQLLSRPQPYGQDDHTYTIGESRILPMV